MKFKIIVIIFLLFSCSSNNTKFDNRTPYYSKGFAIIYNDQDFQNKIIKGKLNNDQLQASHYNLKLNTKIKIINPKTKDSITINNHKRIKFPEFYKILITEEVAKKLNIDVNLPMVEILEIKKNKSFVAKKAKIFNEEKKISTNAPVTSVKISNISKNKKINKNQAEEFFILIGTFYAKETAIFLKQRITKEIPEYKSNKLKIKKKRNKEINLISGPYNTINLIKNDYILLRKFGFEELDILLNE